MTKLRNAMKKDNIKKEIELFLKSNKLEDDEELDFFPINSPNEKYTIEDFKREIRKLHSSSPKKEKVKKIPKSHTIAAGGAVQVTKNNNKSYMARKLGLALLKNKNSPISQILLQNIKKKNRTEPGENSGKNRFNFDFMKKEDVSKTEGDQKDEGLNNEGINLDRNTGSNTDRTRGKQLNGGERSSRMRERSNKNMTTRNGFTSLRRNASERSLRKKYRKSSQDATMPKINLSKKFF